MDKTIYVITTGNYSEYGIDEILFNKELAYAYAEKIGGRVEEYQSADDRIKISFDTYKEYYELHVHFSFLSTNKEHSFYLNLNKNDSINHSPGVSSFIKIEEIRTKVSKKLRQSGYESLDLYFALKEMVDIEDTTIKEKYHKIATDVFSHIQSLMKNEGWSIDMVNEWVSEQYKIIL